MHRLELRGERLGDVGGKITDMENKITQETNQSPRDRSARDHPKFEDADGREIRMEWE